MRKLTLEERDNLFNNKDLIGEFALVLAQMNREQLKITLDVLIVLEGMFEEKDGNLYDEIEIMPLLKEKVEEYKV